MHEDEQGTTALRYTLNAADANGILVNNDIDSSIIQEWINTASQQFIGRINDNHTRNDAYTQLSDYAPQFTFNCSLEPGVFTVKEPELHDVHFIEITGNSDNLDRPIQVMSGKMRIEKGRETWLENMDDEHLKGYLIGIANKIILYTGNPTLSLGERPRTKWATKNAAKAVDRVKELLDEAVADIIQKTFKLQQKLRNFQYIRG